VRVHDLRHTHASIGAGAGRIQSIATRPWASVNL
jgi:hypothetical protein